MSQKYIKSKNNNSHNAKTYNKYYAKPVYDEKFIETDEIADFIQTQATLKRSDIKAALDELGAAMKHFMEMGQKIRLAGIGIFNPAAEAVVEGQAVLRAMEWLAKERNVKPDVIIGHTGWGSIKEQNHGKSINYR